MLRLARVIAILIAVGCLLSSGASAEDYTLNFVGDDGKPIEGASFFLYKLDEKGEFQRAIYRDHNLDDDSSITIDSLPAHFMMGFVNKEKHYDQWWMRGAELKLQPGTNSLKVEKSGSVSLTFRHAKPIGFQLTENPMVIPYYRKQPNGNYELVSGIGIFLVLNNAITIQGLEEGEYLFELKKDYNSPVVLWSEQGVMVKKGQTVELKNLTATKP